MNGQIADKMVDAINNIDNMDKLERKIYIMDMDMQIESFGITWVKPLTERRTAKNEMTGRPTNRQMGNTEI